MADRVLNFSEFQGKYSVDREQDSAAAYDEMSKASDNFQEGFDEDTYEETPIGAKRPISSGESTPPQPGEMGAPSFNHDSGIESPDEEEPAEEEEINPTYGQVDSNDSGNPEDEDEEEDGDEDEEEEDEEEDGDDDEDANESMRWGSSKGVVLESFHSFSNRSGQPRDYDSISNSIEFEDLDLEDEDDEGMICWVKCQSCGSKKEIEPGHDPFHPRNIDDSDSWWQGSEYGMQCGCNMELGCNM